MRTAFVTMALGLWVLACSSDPNEGETSNQADANPASKDAAQPLDAGSASDGGSHAAELGKGMPRVVQPANHGSVIGSPKLVALTYDNDPNRAQIEEFVPQFSKSVAWSATTQEYGVGPLTALAPIHLDGNAPKSLNDSDVHTLLKNQAPLDPNTIYMLFVPAGTTLNDSSGVTCCTDYDGYHGDSTVSGITAAYAVVCSCPEFNGPDISNLQQITIAASHEAMEAATDPFTVSPAYEDADEAHLAWSVVSGGEVGDLCANAETAYWIPHDMTHMVQRSWSNAAAAAGHDPCVGDPTTPYYATIPDLPDTAFIGPYRVTTNTIKIAKGATRTLKLHVYADDDNAGPFTVTVDDQSDNGYLAIVQAGGSFNSGDEVSVDITVNKPDPGLKTAEVFEITTAPVNGKGPKTHYWGMVSQ